MTTKVNSTAPSLKRSAYHYIDTWCRCRNGWGIERGAGKGGWWVVVGWGGVSLQRKDCIFSYPPHSHQRPVKTELTKSQPNLANGVGH